MCSKTAVKYNASFASGNPVTWKAHIAFTCTWHTTFLKSLQQQLNFALKFLETKIPQQKQKNKKN